MKSPFPGMDPYLERYWEDVHTALIGYVRDAVQPQLSDDLIARMEEKVYIDEGPDRLQRRADVGVVEDLSVWNRGFGEDTGTATAVLDEPVQLSLVGAMPPDRAVLIYDRDGNRVVTAVEILSPWNKTPGRRLEDYMFKRRLYQSSAVNLVEIDLVRAGDWSRMIGPYELFPKDRTPYRVSVTVPKVLPYLYPIPLQKRLPRFRVPLRPTDRPAILDLQALLDRAYAMGRYDRTDYTRPCEPPLSPAEQEWVAGVLREAGRA